MAKNWLTGLACISILWLLILAGCATQKGVESSDTREQLGTVRDEIGQLRAAIGRLQGDVGLIDRSLGKLAGRLEALDQRVTASESRPRPTAEVPRPEPRRARTEASEVPVKKAPEPESRPASSAPGPIVSERSEARGGQARQPSMEASAATREGPKGLRQGMTQEDVRRLWGNPHSTQVTVFYLYWNYPDKKWVSFAWTGHVRAWEGF